MKNFGAAILSILMIIGICACGVEEKKTIIKKEETTYYDLSTGKVSYIHSYTYDEKGKLEKEIYDYLNEKTEIKYEPEEKKNSCIFRGYVESNALVCTLEEEYGEVGNVICKKMYDQDGNMMFTQEIKWANGVKKSAITYSYDDSGEKIAEYHLEFDEYQNTISEKYVNRDGQIYYHNGYEFKYDKNGKIERCKKVNKLTDDILCEIEYTYDDKGNLVEKKQENEFIEKYKYDSRGNIIEKSRYVKDVLEYTISYEYY